MGILRKLPASLVLAALLVCIFGWLTVPQEGQGGLMTVYSRDGRILELEPEAAQAYLADGWSEDYKQVAAVLWRTDGSSKLVPQAKAAVYAPQGWHADKAEVLVTMEDRDGNEIDVFQDWVKEYEPLGWKTKKPPAPAPTPTPPPAETSTPSSHPALALTFDDGPSAGTTDRLLDILEENGAKATFFMLGNRVPNAADTVARMQEAGMELGSHTYDHTDLTKLDGDALRRQIDQTSQSIAKAAGAEPTLLRPPYGNYNAALQAAAGTPLILWSVDTEDWKSRNADKVYEAAMAGARNGAILLFHDIYGTTVDAMERLVPALQEEGYDLVTVSELAEMRGKELQPGVVYGSF